VTDPLRDAARFVIEARDADACAALDKAIDGLESALAQPADTSPLEVWVGSSKGGSPCHVEVVVRAEETGMYGDRECVIDCHGIADHDGPHFALDIDGYTVMFVKEGAK
jgi:hypothetical protein